MIAAAVTADLVPVRTVRIGSVVAAVLLLGGVAGRAVRMGDFGA
ncbi:hypothetical protein [Fodinicola feengrottensis]|nr:hypothetical protein [Fodinicola feengrottensis]